MFPIALRALVALFPLFGVYDGFISKIYIIVPGLEDLHNCAWLRRFAQWCLAYRILRLCLALKICTSVLCPKITRGRVKPDGKPKSKKCREEANFEIFL